MLPNLIIIGAQKCGTTALHNYLQLHPEVFMSKIKELNFFAKDTRASTWAKGVNWYKTWFPKSNVSIYGESSPSYTAYPISAGVPERMHSIIPNARLIYMVRDPIKRVISSYIHSRRTGHYRGKSFEQILEGQESLRLIACSKYYMQICQYLPYYSQEKILIVSQESLYSNRQETLQQIFKYLGISPNFYSLDFEKEYHQTQAKTHELTTLGYQLRKFYMEWSAKSGLGIDQRKKVSRLIFKVFSTPLEKPIITNEIQRKLVEHLKEDVARFRELTGQTFSEWNL
jgi:hypothetical protein